MIQAFAGASHRITLAKAREMVARYSASKTEILKPSYSAESIFITSETFQRDDLDALLLQEGCAGLRIYFSMDENLSVRTILVGVTAGNQDILTSAAGDEGVIVEEGRICPPECPVPPSLSTIE